MFFPIFVISNDKNHAPICVFYIKPQGSPLFHLPIPSVVFALGKEGPYLQGTFYHPTRSLVMCVYKEQNLMSRVKFFLFSQSLVEPKGASRGP